MSRGRWVQLSDADVDVIAKVAVVASNDVTRPLLNGVHVRDGLAFATDSYRLAFGEVDCEDCQIPAQAARWLPFHGGDIKIEHSRVSWPAGGGIVGGYALEWPHLDAETIVKWIGEPPSKIGRLPNRKIVISPLDNFDQKLVMIGPRPGPHSVVDHAFLAPLVKALEPGARVGLSGIALWLWDDEVTYQIMPVAPSQAWSWWPLEDDDDE